MQTVANMASRLDMSTKEALEVLRKLGVNVDGVDSEITDQQCDMLMDVDEDPSAIDRFLDEKAKREEKERKRKENLQKAAKKAAEKRKAAASKKKAAAKKKPAAKKKTAAKEPSKEAEPEDGEAPAGTVVEEKAVSEAPVAEIIAPPEEAPPVSAETADEAPAPADKPEAPPVVAEIIESEPEAAPSPETREEAAAGGSEPDAAPEASPAETTEAPTVRAAIIDEAAPTAPPRLPKRSEAEIESEASAGGGALARAERRQEEAQRRKKQQKPAKPLPTPDPAVVAEVIRRANERERAKEARRTGGAAPLRDVARRTGPPERAAAAKPSLESEAREATFRKAAKKPATGLGKTAKKRKKRAERARVQEEIMRREAGAAVRGVLAGGLIGGAPRKRRKKRSRDEEMVQEEVSGGMIEVDETMTVEQLADAMNVEINDIILQLMEDNILATKNQTLELELIRRIADSYGFEVRTIIPEEEEIFAEEPDKPEDLVVRAPVVTVMGHVDHGKTSLLDVVREASVVEGEAGGITQHIAAYDVKLNQGRVVFLDTPGHEAFTQMRARGAGVTDVVVLVVAADDGIKPQTIEAIDHARAAGVPIVVAINKCDKPDAQPDRVRQELTKYDLVAEEWGGKTIIKNISAKTREGVTDLMEMLVLESEMLDLKANPNKPARGTVVESEMSTGQGPVAWVLVQSGTLRPGDSFLSGETYGRVRTMTSSNGVQVEEAGPSTPVLVTGFSAVPVAGDSFIQVKEERVARGVAEKRANLNRQKRGAVSRHMTLEDFHARMEGAEEKHLNVIIKADVQGSVDVLQSSLAKLGNVEVKVVVVHSSVGGVSESDVLLASASDAVVLGFHVGANARTRQMAEAEGVEIRTYLVIYELIDEVRKALEGMLTPDTREVVVGHAEIREVFRSSALGNIAGCIQQDGTTDRGALARLLRDNVVIYTGKLLSVRRGKEDVKSVAAGFECGLRLERFDDIQAGDIIETYKLESVAKKL